MWIFNLILLIFCVLVSPAFSYDSSNAIKVVYPPPQSSIEAPSTFLVGQIPVGSSLTCNNESVRVNQSGYFAHVVPLHYGINNFSLSLSNGEQLDSSKLEWSVSRKAPAKPISPNELKIVVQKPNSDLGVTPGDVISFAVRATPHSAITVQLGQHQITLSPLQKNHPSASTDVAYGKTIQRYDTNDSDQYKGSYRVTDSDRFLSVHPLYKLSGVLGNLSVAGKTTISTVDRLYIARTAKTPTIVRLGPGLARTSPLVEGVKVVIDGWTGDNMRCLYSTNRHVWIAKQNLVMESEKEFPTGMLKAEKSEAENVAPQAVAQTINVTENDKGEKICLPLSERLPYEIEQKLNPNCLILRVYGVTSDTDWITNEPKANEKANRQSDPNNEIERPPIDHVTWRQAEDNVYEITAHLSGKRQWGYRISYEGTTLCLNIRRPPSLSGDGTLKGLKICIDPGHGGSENGSLGCSGVPESVINFEIASQVKTCLENLGATVIMTRNSINETVSLDDRVKIATDNDADFLVSIHNNALPDGRDPWKEHGTSSYWYHPQSIELAARLKESVKKASGFVDLGARYQNLALARGTAMPSVLLEIGFMINPDEFSCLIDPQFQHKIAGSIASGIKKYLEENQYPKKSDYIN